MQYKVMGPGVGPSAEVYATFVQALGPGRRSDPERLEAALAVALPGNDITIDLREVEELGPDGIAAASHLPLTARG